MSKAKKPAATKKSETPTPEQKEKKLPLTPDEKAAKFKEIATRRLKGAANQIKNIGNLSNKSSYVYTPEQVDKVFALLQKSIDVAKAKFEEKKKKEEVQIEL